jgi:F420 biosynthesis protein FbiB-like protein
VLTSPVAKICLVEALGEAFRRDLLADGLTEEQADLQLSHSRQRILSAPVAVLLCLDTALGDTYRDERRQQAESLMGVQSVALAGGQLLLAAHAEGLGGVWMCAPLFAPDAARSALELPAAWQPQALLLLGYPAQIPAPRPRRPLDEITLFY